MACGRLSLPVGGYIINGWCGRDELRLETFLPPPHLADIHIVLTEDWNGMNAGVFPIRVRRWSIELLSAAIALPIMNPDINLFWQEQSSLVSLLETDTTPQAVNPC